MNTTFGFKSSSIDYTTIVRAAENSRLLKIAKQNYQIETYLPVKTTEMKFHGS